MKIVDQVYRVTNTFPKTELFSLTDQMKRAAISIPSNIAEGFPRQSKKEYRQFLSIALGSCSELETQLIIAKSRNYVNEAESESLEGIINYECKMIQNLLKLLK